MTSSQPLCRLLLFALVLCTALALALAPPARAQDAPPAAVPALRFDLLEWQDREPGGTLKWDVEGSFALGQQRFLLRDEGHVTRGALRQNRAEILWLPPRFWDSVRWLDRFDWLDLFVGVRHDNGDAPKRTYGALGVRGMSPWGIGVDITGYLGEGSPNGDAVHNGYRFQFDYAYEFTPRLALLARFDYEIFSEDHVWYSFGIAPTETSAGLRLRYRAGPQFEPYVGAEWAEFYGDSRDIVRQLGLPVSEVRMVAGVRLRLPP